MNTLFFRLLAAALFALCCLPGGITKAAAQEYVHGFDFHEPPYIFLDEEGKARGCVADFVEALGRETGVIFTHAPQRRLELPTRLDQGVIHMTTTPLPTHPDGTQDVSRIFSESVQDAKETPPQGQQKTLLSEPYAIDELVLVLRADDTLTIDELLNGPWAVGVQISSEAHDLLLRIKKERASLLAVVPYFGTRGILNKLVDGEVKACLVGRRLATYAAHTLKLPVRIAPGPGLASSTRRIAVHGANAELLRRINEGLGRLQKSGEMQILMRCGARPE